MRRLGYALAAAAAATVLAVAAGGLALAAGGLADVTFSGCLAGGKLTSVSVTRTPSCAASATAVQWQGKAAVTVSPSPTPTSPSPTPTPTTPSPTPTGTGTCSKPLGGVCGPYGYAGIPMSNGFDTYVSNQDVGANSATTETVSVTDPGNWSLTADAQPYGYLGVQTFPDVQQLTNDWCGTGWGGCANPGSTPLDSLSALKVNYAETSPAGPGDVYEFAPDVWSEGYPSDVMFWADTRGRCDQGAFGGTVLGNVVLGGQPWTVHRYGGPGAEIIFVLDGPGGTGTCAQQASGTIDIKAGFDWLTSHGFVAAPEVITQLNTGWEITSAANATFTMSSYSITATAG